MTAPDRDSDLRRLGDALRASAAVDLVSEEQRTRAAAAPATRRRRRGLLAGASLALAGAAAAAVVLVVGGSEGAPPAYAVTRTGDGSVLIEITKRESIVGANAQLTAMHVHEEVTIDNEPGPATVHTPIGCRVLPGAQPRPMGPKIRVLEDQGRTIIPDPNSGIGPRHLAACWITSDRYRGGASLPPPSR